MSDRREVLYPAVQLHAVRLTIFAAAVAALVSLTWLLTEQPIIHQMMLSQHKALTALLPGHLFDNTLPDSRVFLPEPARLNLNENENPVGFLATRNGKSVAVILPVVAPQGYSGSIKLMVAILKNGSISKVQVINHRETPGLGDAIETEKSDWMQQFERRSLHVLQPDAWQTKKDHGSFDQITGATITSRAVTAAIKNALLYFEAHKNVLLDTNQVTTGEKNRL